MKGHPEEGTAVASKLSVLDLLEVGGDLHGLGSVDVGASAGAGR